jgi:uncharacterized protein YqgC (DUF456 family)
MGELFSQSFVLFLTLFIMLVGLVLTIIPVIPFVPGTVIMWGAVIGYGLLAGWDKLGWPAFAIITLIFLLGLAADAAAGHLGAKMGGASWSAVAVGVMLGFIIGLIATFIGTPLLGCLAGLLGTVAGVLLVEYRRRQNWQVALNATKGYVAGSFLGAVAKAVSAGLMLAVFLARVYLWP